MKHAWLGLAVILATTSCGVLGHRSADSPVISPAQVADFRLLYTQHCAGCHGPDGHGGLALGLADPVYLTISDDTTIRSVTAEGVPGTAMPAFGQQAGGLLTDDQIEAIVHGIRNHWAKANALRDADPPPYAAQGPGDPERGATVYGVYCSSCHGADGRGGSASSIVDGSYLGLVSNQGLRTTVIVGRPELGAPDWRGDLPGKQMSPEDISDVVAWLAAKRTQFPSQPYSSVQLRGEIR
jgi:cytochrome c oxidase cbb3-type subunit 3